MRKAAALTLFAVLSVVACDGKSGHHGAVEALPSGPKFDAPATDPFANSAPKVAVAPANPEPGPGNNIVVAPAKAEPPPADPPAADPPAGDAPAAPGGADDPLGVRFRDPPWFRKTIFPDATKTDFKRSQADDKGLFSSQILFDLASGATVDDCVSTLQDRVSKSVTNLETNKTADRVTIKGNTDRYTVTMVCGEVQGVTKAYVSYSWTS